MIDLLKQGFLKRIKSQLSKNKTVQPSMNYITEFLDKYPGEKENVDSILNETGLSREYKKLKEKSSKKIKPK